MVSTRTVVQIRTHAQKYFQKINKGRAKDDRILSTAEGSVDSAFKRRIIGKSRSKKRKSTYASVDLESTYGVHLEDDIALPFSNLRSKGKKTDTSVSGDSSPSPTSITDGAASQGDTGPTSHNGVAHSGVANPRGGPEPMAGGPYTTSGPVKRTRSNTGLMFMDVDTYGGAEDPYNVYTGYDEPVCGDPWESYENLEGMRPTAAEVGGAATPLQMLQPMLAASKATTGGLRRQRNNDGSVGSSSITSSEDLSSDESGPDNGTFTYTPVLTANQDDSSDKAHGLDDHGGAEGGDASTDDSDAGSAAAVPMAPLTPMRDSSGTEDTSSGHGVEEDDELCEACAI